MNTLTSAILKMGGIQRSALRDVTGETRTGHGVKGIASNLFCEDGRGLDDLAISLREVGYLIPDDSVDGGVQALKDMIRDETEGNRHYSAFDEQAQFDKLARIRDAQYQHEDLPPVIEIPVFTELTSWNF